MKDASTSAVEKKDTSSSTTKKNISPVVPSALAASPASGTDTSGSIAEEKPTAGETASGSMAEETPQDMLTD